MLDPWNSFDENATVAHLLWTLALLKQYAAESALSTLTGADESTVIRGEMEIRCSRRSGIQTGTSKQIALDVLFFVIDCFTSALKLAPIEFVFCRLSGKTGDALNDCLISVDGTDFRIQEPMSFSKEWSKQSDSHKFNGPGLRFEVGCQAFMPGSMVLTNVDLGLI